MEDSLTDLIGFTESELRENYMDILKFYCHEDYIETELRNINYHYNGYKFNVSAVENRVYSPVSVIRHIKSSLFVYKTTFQNNNSTNEGILFIIINLFFDSENYPLKNYWTSTGPTGKIIQYYEKCFEDKASEKVLELLEQKLPLTIETDMVENNATLAIP